MGVHMRKLFAITLLLVLIFSVIPAKAASSEVLRGTPQVDGVLDEIYTQSVSQSITTENQVYNSGAEYADSDVAGISYMLYDGSFVYVCTVVTCSSAIDTAGDAYIMTDGGTNPWMNDVVENWFEFDGVKKKISLDAYGKRVFGDPEVTGSEGYVGAAVITDTGYIVEFAVPYTGTAGTEIGYSLQINDKIGEGIIAIGSQTPLYYKLGSGEVTYPEPETEAPETEPAQANAPAAAAAQTSDVSLIFVFAALACSAMLIRRGVKNKPV